MQVASQGRTLHMSTREPHSHGLPKPSPNQSTKQPPRRINVQRPNPSYPIGRRRCRRAHSPSQPSQTGTVELAVRTRTQAYAPSCAPPPQAALAVSAASHPPTTAHRSELPTTSHPRPVPRSQPPIASRQRVPLATTQPRPRGEHSGSFAFADCHTIRRPLRIVCALLPTLGVLATLPRLLNQIVALPWRLFLV
jgi:hypothetical protein